MADNALLELNRLRQAGRRALLATVVRGEGPTYRPPGSSAVITEDGQVFGAISGGCIEADLLATAASIFEDGRPRLLTYDTDSPDDLIWGTASGCGGRIQVLLAPVADGVLVSAAERLGRGEAVILETVITEGADLGHRSLLAAPVAALPDGQSEGGRLFRNVISPPVTLLICGAGDDARPVITLAAAAGFRVVVTDHRPGQLSAERLTTVDVRVCCPAEELRDHLGIGEGWCAVILSHQYQHDLAYLEALLGSPAAYVGLLGSWDRSTRLLEELLSAHPELERAIESKLRAPVGLDIGADGPDEIALAIVAELVAFRSGRSGAPLTSVRGLPPHATRGGA